jgi:hypothetical protein
MAMFVHLAAEKVADSIRRMHNDFSGEQELDDYASTGDSRVSAFLKKVVRFVEPLILWFGRRFLSWDRLDKVELIELDSPFDDVVSLYGNPIESEPDQWLPGATLHTMRAGPFHDVMIVEWKNRVCFVAYWPVYPDPNRDLKCMLEKYGENIGWREHEPGYVCIRNDEKVWLRCSVVSSPSVETSEYLEAKLAVARSK